MKYYGYTVTRRDGDRDVEMTSRRNPMKMNLFRFTSINALIALTLLLPAIVQAETIPTRSLHPVVRVADNVLYLSDKRGNDWIVVTRCKISSDEIEQFTVRGKVIRQGKVIRINSEKTCEVQSVKLV